MESEIRSRTADEIDAEYGLAVGTSQKFYEALRAEDDLGMIIRAHIHIESLLHQYILAAAPVPSHVNFNEYDFDQTVKLALILGLQTDFKPPLNALGSLRNRFAHRLDSKIDDAAANSIYSSLSASAKQIVQRTYDNVLKKLNSDRPKKFSLLPCRDRIELCLMSLRQGLMVFAAGNNGSPIDSK